LVTDSLESIQLVSIGLNDKEKDKKSGSKISARFLEQLPKGLYELDISENNGFDFWEIIRVVACHFVHLSTLLAAASITEMSSITDEAA